jgi:hypothetical protein
MYWVWGCGAAGLAGWVGGWMDGYLAAWLPGCLAAWLPGCLAAWLGPPTSPPAPTLPAAAGNFWADVAYNCLPYHLPANVPGLPVLAQPLPPGVPSERQYLSDYCARRGLQPPAAQDWAFYMALSLFRWAAVAVLLHL